MMMSRTLAIAQLTSLWTMAADIKTIVIIGGGISGFTCALELLQANTSNFNIILLEASNVRCRFSTCSLLCLCAHRQRAYCLCQKMMTIISVSN
jgi:heterodisulfide reductase subunit A-like polyferredoxin